MADQTTSSIVVDAPPAAVMAVIADFPAYPSWAKGVVRADVLAVQPTASAPRGLLRARRPADQGRVHARLHVGRRPAVTWTLAEGKMLKALDGAYVLRDLGRRLAPR
jgi:hypothetical protein